MQADLANGVVTAISTRHFKPELKILRRAKGPLPHGNDRVASDNVVLADHTTRTTHIRVEPGRRAIAPDASADCPAASVFKIVTSAALLKNELVKADLCIPERFMD